MAEEKKESKGSRRYGKGPKIVADKVMDEGVDKTEPKKSTEGAAPESEEASGTDKIPVSEAKPTEPAGETNEGSGMAMHEVHTREAKALNTSHEKQRRDMNTRHETEYAAMRKKHEKEASK